MLLDTPVTVISMTDSVTTSKTEQATSSGPIMLDQPLPILPDRITTTLVQKQASSAKCFAFSSYVLNKIDHLKFIPSIRNAIVLIYCINAAYYAKPLILIMGSFREKLVSHHQAVNINC